MMSNVHRALGTPDLGRLSASQTVTDRHEYPPALSQPGPALHMDLYSLCKSPVSKIEDKGTNHSRQWTLGCPEPMREHVVWTGLTAKRWIIVCFCRIRCGVKYKGAITARVVELLPLQSFSGTHLHTLIVRSLTRALTSLTT